MRKAKILAAAKKVAAKKNRADLKKRQKEARLARRSGA